MWAVCRCWIGLAHGTASDAKGWDRFKRWTTAALVTFFYSLCRLSQALVHQSYSGTEFQQKLKRVRRSQINACLTRFPSPWLKVAVLRDVDGFVETALVCSAACWNHAWHGP